MIAALRTTLQDVAPHRQATVGVLYNYCYAFLVAVSLQYIIFNTWYQVGR